MHRTCLAGVGLLVAAIGIGCGGRDRSSSAGPFGAGSTTAGATSAVVAAPTTATRPVGGVPAPNQGPAYLVAGWLPYWSTTTGDPSVNTNTGDGLDEVNLFGIGIRPDGTLTSPQGAIDDPQRVAAVRARGGEVIPTVYDVNDTTALGAVLASPTATRRAVQEIVGLLDRGGYEGIDIDFEHATSSNRDQFSSFVADLSREVRARGKVFSVTIPGKPADLPNWPGYDYAALGAVADRVKIMTYGYSGPWSSRPGPIAPTTWIRRVLDYAVTVIPPDTIQLGIPFYGYDWPSNGGTIRSVTYRRSQTLLASNPPPAGVVFDTTLGEATFAYTDAQGVSHTVWFSEERSVAAKSGLVKQYGLRGLAIWALGYGDRPLWDAVRQQLKTP